MYVRPIFFSGKCFVIRDFHPICIRIPKLHEVWIWTPLVFSQISPTISKRHSLISWGRFSYSFMITNRYRLFSKSAPLGPLSLHDSLRNALLIYLCPNYPFCHFLSYLLLLRLSVRTNIFLISSLPCPIFLPHCIKMLTPHYLLLKSPSIPLCHSGRLIRIQAYPPVHALRGCCVVQRKHDWKILSTIF